MASRSSNRSEPQLQPPPTNPHPNAQAEPQLKATTTPANKRSGESVSPAMRSAQGKEETREEGQRDASQAGARATPGTMSQRL